MKKPKCNIPQKFMLVCFLGQKNEEYRNECKRIEQENKLQTVDLFDLKYSSIGPQEYLWLVQNAEYVCTDSFHACAFCVIFHKEFTAFRRIGTYFADMFDRIDTLLSDIGLSGHIYGNKCDDETD